MDFEWDEAKRQAVIIERQVDILRAARIFEGPVVTAIDSRHDYGEARLVSLGMVDDEAYVVVHTIRNGVVRLITAWNGGESGKKRYQASVPSRHPADG